MVVWLIQSWTAVFLNPTKETNIRTSFPFSHGSMDPGEGLDVKSDQMDRSSESKPVNRLHREGELWTSQGQVSSGSWSQIRVEWILGVSHDAGFDYSYGWHRRIQKQYTEWASVFDELGVGTGCSLHNGHNVQIEKR